MAAVLKPEAGRWEREYAKRTKGRLRKLKAVFSVAKREVENLKEELGRIRSSGGSPSKRLKDQHAVAVRKVRTIRREMVGVERELEQTLNVPNRI